MTFCDKSRGGIMVWMCKAASFLIILTILQLRGIDCLQMRNVNVPTHPVAGQSVYLGCEFDMERDELYSITWYKSGEEFYRYLPRDQPPAQIYHVDGIKVELNSSDGKIVTLRDIGLPSTGVYRCEVSAEAPSFITVSGEKEMNVIAIPSEGPKIAGTKPKYEIGDSVKVNCTSSKSKPAAMLTWTINGNKAPKDYLIEYATNVDVDDDEQAEDEEEEEEEQGLDASTLGLEFRVRDTHFNGGEMRLRCSATIAPIYHESNEELFLGGINQLAAVMESKSKESAVKVHADQENGAGVLLSNNLLWILLTIAVF